MGSTTLSFGKGIGLSLSFEAQRRMKIKRPVILIIQLGPERIKVKARFVGKYRADDIHFNFGRHSGNADIGYCLLWEAKGEQDTELVFAIRAPMKHTERVIIRCEILFASYRSNASSCAPRMFQGRLNVSISPISRPATPLTGRPFHSRFGICRGQLPRHPSNRAARYSRHSRLAP